MTVDPTKAPRSFRFSRRAYHRLGKAGLLPRESRLELLDGAILQMVPTSPLHNGVRDKLGTFFTAQVTGRAVCRIRGPIALDGFSEPEPDLSLLVPRSDNYTVEHPGPSDVLLIVEIAEAAIGYNLGPKRRQYARAGIEEYWVFDLNRKVLIVNRQPLGDVYADVREGSRTATVYPTALPDVLLPLDDILNFGA